MPAAIKWFKYKMDIPCKSNNNHECNVLNEMKIQVNLGMTNPVVKPIDQPLG